MSLNEFSLSFFSPYNKPVYLVMELCRGGELFDYLSQTESKGLTELQAGELLMIYVCNFHFLSHLLLIYICKLHWNLKTMFVCQVISF